MTGVAWGQQSQPPVGASGKSAREEIARGIAAVREAQE